jgi:PAS domain-containing protein
MLARRTFEAAKIGLESTLWITAHCSYNLFINERFCGFGPRSSHYDASFVDMYDVSGYLQDGLNSIALVIYSTTIPHGSQEPGFWCQLESAGEPMLASDGEWHMFECAAMTAPRPRCGRNRMLTEYLDSSRMPERWMEPKFEISEDWRKPDRIGEAGAGGTELKLYPLTPSTIDSLIDFAPVDHGVIEEKGAWTQVIFNCHCRSRHPHAVCAAETYMYSETGKVLKLKIFSDDPFKLFCNNMTVSSADRSDGMAEHSLVLRKGWNRLLAVQEPRRNSMGIFMLFPDRNPGGIMIYQRPDEDAEPCWTMAGPLRLPLFHATSSLCFDGLETEAYRPYPAELTDISNFLKIANFKSMGQGGRAGLRTGEFVRYKLDVLRYGFPVVELEAAAGDVIDVSFGYKLTENGLPSRGELCRATHTMRCRSGLNRFMFFYPREGCQLMLSVRKAAGEIRIVNCSIEELLRLSGVETEFACSDAEFNEMWRVGVQTMRRSSAFVPQTEINSEYDNYLLDSYIDSINMVGTLGGYEYSVIRLRQFVEAQFENGDIPVLTFAKRCRSQVHQLFFLPIWMLYNYRVGGDVAELRSLWPSLERLRQFYHSLIDEETGMIGDIDERFGLKSPLGPGKFEPNSVPTYVNALFCRFLLSSAEVLRVVGNGELAAVYLEEAKNISHRLYVLNFDQKARLFVRSSPTGRARNAEHPREFNLFANLTALMSGVMPLDNFEHFFFRYFNTELPFDRTQEAANPYFHFLFMETMYALGQGGWANRYLRDYWRKRICRENSTWLSWHDGWSPAPSRFFDGNVVSPNIFLIREVAGVRMVNSDHTSLYFNPALHQIEWANLSMPTPFGKIRVQWQREKDFTLNVMIDSNYPVKVLPELSAEQLRKTSFELSPNVVLLAPPEMAE